jgi:3-phenylpropionate/cinnamic acid dioxygenase small subunit
MSPSVDELADRIQRIQDTLDIQQLAVRYAMAVDERDIDAWLELFPPDVRVGRDITGREALRDFIVPQVQLFYRSVHQIVGHRIELLSADRATGAVYCRAEHEVGDRWIVIAIRYDDEYQKIDGKWYFARRKDKHWYEADLVARPQDVAFSGWPDAPSRPRVPDSASWTSFWDGVDTSMVTGYAAGPQSKESR